MRGSDFSCLVGEISYSDQASCTHLISYMYPILQVASLKDLNEAVRLAEPDSQPLEEALRRRAVLLQGQGHHREAADTIREILSACPSAVGGPEQKMRLTHMEAQSRAKDGDFAVAVRCLEEEVGHLDAAGGISQDSRERLRDGIKNSIKKLVKKVGREKKSGKETRKTLSPPPPHCLEFRQSPEAGRFTVAGADGVSCGSLLMEEDPVVALLNPDCLGDLWRFCSHCLSPCALSPLPCPGCSSAIFCSSRCRLQAAGSYHRYECRLNLAQHRVEDAADAYRFLLSARVFFQYPLAELSSAWEGGDGGGSHPKLSRLFRMMKHQGERPRWQELKLVVMAVLVLALLRDSGYLDEQEVVGGMGESDVLRMAHDLLQIQDVNTHPVLTALGDGQEDGGGRGEVGVGRIGSAINAEMGSFFNHSCNPNTCR